MGSETKSTPVKDVSSELPEPVQNGIMTENNNEVAKTVNSSNNEDVKVSTENIINETESSVEEKLKSVQPKIEENIDNITVEKVEENVEVKESQKVEELLNMDTPLVVSETKSSVEGNLESVIKKTEENIETKTIE